MLLLMACGGGMYFVFSNIVPSGEDSWRHYSGGGMFVTDSPSLASDGDELAFATPVTGHGDIYLVGVRTKAVRRLTHTSECELSPHFLPGSKQIVFEREQVPYRHVWLRDLQSGEERQLTSGKVLDDISSVSPTGKHILVGRSTNWGMGREVQPHLLAVDSGDIQECKGVAAAHFADNGVALVTSRQEEELTFGLENLDGQRKPPLGRGWVTDSCDQAGLLVYTHLGERIDPPNSELFCFDRAHSQTVKIGHGHSACIFASGQVLYYVGFKHQAMIWEAGQRPRAITSPAGYKVFPNRSADGMSAAMFVMPPNQPSRLYDIYLFDSESESFTPFTINLPLSEE